MGEIMFQKVKTSMKISCGDKLRKFFPQKNFAVIKTTIFHQRIMARLEKMHFDFFIWA